MKLLTMKKIILVILFCICVNLAKAAGDSTDTTKIIVSDKMQSGIERPNVIIVLSDDQGYGDFSCHGNPVLKTPALDKLYNESIRVSNFHVALDKHTILVIIILNERSKSLSNKDS